MYKLYNISDKSKVFVGYISIFKEALKQSERIFVQFVVHSNKEMFWANTAKTNNWIPKKYR